MTEPPSVLLQARVPQDLAQDVQDDIRTLGLDGVSDAIREGLRLLHAKARLAELAQQYDDFYGGPAPVSTPTAALYET